MQNGHIYVLTNSAHRHLVKVGKTKRPVAERAAEISSHEGVPRRFKIYCAFECVDIERAESLSHKMLSRFRDRSDREFFEMSAEKAAEMVKACVALVNGTLQDIRDEASAVVAAMQAVEVAETTESLRQSAFKGIDAREFLGLTPEGEEIREELNKLKEQYKMKRLSFEQSVLKMNQRQGEPMWNNELT